MSQKPHADSLESNNPQDEISLEDDDLIISSNGRNISLSLTHRPASKSIFQRALENIRRLRFEWRSRGFAFGLLGHVLLLSGVWFFVAAVLWAAPVQRCTDLHHQLQWTVVGCGLVILASLITFVSARCHCSATPEVDNAMELALLDESGSSTGTSATDRQSSGDTDRGSASCCLRRVLCYVMVVVVLLVAGLTAMALFVHLEGSPSAGAPIDGLLSLPGLYSPVRVTRDDAGVLHVDALNQHDMFLAQGFVMAQQRLFQMELTLHAGRGELSAALGQVTLDVDREMRTLGLARLAARTSAWLAQTHPKEYALLEAFCRGVNEYVTQATFLPVEFALTGIQPREYGPTDVVLLSKLMAFDMGKNPHDELRRWRMVREAGLTRREVEEQWPRYSQNPEWPFVVPLKELNVTMASLPTWLLEALGDAPPAAQEWSSHNDSWSKRQPWKREEKRWHRPWDVFWGRTNEMNLRASNNWVVSGRLTRSGKPLLAADPHLHWQLPPLWLLMHLHDAETGLNAIGAALAGAPGLVFGRNEHIAWGSTDANTDVADLIELELVADRPGYYWHGQEPRTLRHRTERIAVKSAPDLLLNVTLSDFGPVINSAWNLPSSFPMLALRWAVDPHQAAGAEDTTLLAINQLLHARNFSAFRDAMNLWTAPASNVVFGDTLGNIGYQCTGRTPLRPRNDSRARGDWPQPSRSASLWSAFVPPEALPHVLNPAEGFIVSANNAVAPFPEYPVLIVNDRDWEMGYRAMRIRAEIQRAVAESRPLELADMQRLQTDQVSLVWSALRPLALRVLELSVSERLANASKWLQRLLDWNGDLRGPAAEAVLFERWLLELHEATRGPWSRLPKEPQALVLHYARQPDRQCEGSAQTCAYQALAALQTALNTPLAVTDWRHRHQALFGHALFDNTPLECAYNRRVPFGGDPYTVSPGASPHSQRGGTHGASYRQLVDLDDPERSLFVLAGGQSENALSSSYDDLLSVWALGKLLPMQMSHYSVVHSLKLDPLLKRPSSSGFMDSSQAEER